MLDPFVLEDVKALRYTQSLALFRLAVPHLSAVGARRLVAVLDQLLEALEVAAHLTLDDAEHIPGNVLRGRLALDVHLNVDARLVPSDLLGADDAVVFDLAVDRLPGDLLVRLLLSDLRRPLTSLASNLRDPVDVRVVELLHGLDALHELRKVLKLRPLVIGLLKGNLNLDRILNFWHATSPHELCLGDLGDAHWQAKISSEGH